MRLKSLRQHTFQSGCREFESRPPLPRTTTHNLVRFCAVEASGIPSLWTEHSDQGTGDRFTFHGWYSLAANPQKYPFHPRVSEPLGSITNRCHVTTPDINVEALATAVPEHAIKATLHTE